LFSSALRDIPITQDILIHQAVDSAMHSAPALTYPVGRSRFQVWLLCLIGLVSVSAGLRWVQQSGPVDWRQGLFAVTLLIYGLVDVLAWRRTPTGTLHWDGQVWGWTEMTQSLSGAVTVHLDLQFCMVLSLQSENGSRIWLWPERRRDPVRWSALRRAVFSRAASGHVGAANVATDGPNAQVKS
jgi:toxin CptA